MRGGEDHPAAGHDSSSRRRAGRVADLIAGAREGDDGATNALVEVLYQELKKIAHHVRGSNHQTTLPTTALIHEAWLRLARAGGGAWRDESHFVAVSARAMRQALVDHARARTALKRGGAHQPVCLDECAALYEERQIDVLAVDEALDRLAGYDDDLRELTELHVFLGFSLVEIAALRGCSVDCVARSWSTARAWLRSSLSDWD